MFYKSKIRTNISEALGVPENIHETSLKLFGKIYNWSKNLRKKDFKSGQGARTIFRGDFRVADYEFSTIKVQLGIEEFPQLEEPQMVSMVTRTESKKTEDFKLQSIKRKSIDLLMIVGVPEEFNYKKISDFMLSHKNGIFLSFVLIK